MAASPVVVDQVDPHGSTIQNRYVPVSIESLIAGHREIERALDPLSASVAAGTIDPDALHRARALCIRHYGSEEDFLNRLAARDRALAAKMRGQHSEAMELAGRLEEALAAGHSRDALYLARRFLAIAQHNIIEEERDVFPFAADA